MFSPSAVKSTGAKEVMDGKWPEERILPYQPCWFTLKKGVIELSIQICSEMEWESTKSILKIEDDKLSEQPFGEYFEYPINQHECRFYHSGDTKTKAAAACQFAIDTWHPDAIANIGTCGGVSEDINLLDIIVAETTVQYDCILRFGGSSEFFYAPMITPIGLSWIDFSKISKRLYKGTIATADQDLNHEWRKLLQGKNVLGADWESGAIAKVCELNGIKCLILRGVSDIPKEHPSPDQDTQDIHWRENTPKIMKDLLEVLEQISF
jgi:nucleoside phosphorylase